LFPIAKQEKRKDSRVNVPCRRCAGRRRRRAKQGKKGFRMSPRKEKEKGHHSASRTGEKKTVTPGAARVAQRLLKLRGSPPDPRSHRPIPEFVPGSSTSTRGCCRIPGEVSLTRRKRGTRCKRLASTRIPGVGPRKDEMPFKKPQGRGTPHPPPQGAHRNTRTRGRTHCALPRKQATESGKKEGREQGR